MLIVRVVSVYIAKRKGFNWNCNFLKESLWNLGTSFGFYSHSFLRIFTNTQEALKTTKKLSHYSNENSNTKLSGKMRERRGRVELEEDIKGKI